MFTWLLNSPATFGDGAKGGETRSLSDKTECQTIQLPPRPVMPTGFTRTLAVP